MNRRGIATAACLFSIVMVPVSAARAAAEAVMPDWQSMSPPDLLWAAKNLTIDDPAVKAARKGLAGHVGARFLADPATIRTLSLSQWGELAGYLSGELADDQRGQWIGRIRGAYVQDAAGLALLKTSLDLGALINTLGRLGDKQAAAAAAAFLNGSTSWHQWSPGEKAKLAGQISALGEEGRDACRVLANHVTTQYLAAVPGVKSVAAKDWAVLAESLAQALSAEARGQWMDKILEAYAPTSQAMAALSASDKNSLKAVVASLIEGQEGSSVAVGFVTQKIAWMSWPPADLEWLVAKLPGDEAERRKITDRMIERLQSARKNAGSMAPEDWQRLTVLIGPDLPEQQCSQLLEGLQGAFYGQAGGFQSLDPKARERLVRAMKALGAAPEDIADLPLNFVLEKTGWRAWDANDLLALAATVENRKGEKAQSARELLAGHVRTKYLAGESAVRSISCAKWKALAQRLGGQVPNDAKADWAEKLYNAFAGDPKVLSGLTKDQVGDLAEAMRMLGSPKAGVIVLGWMSSRPRSQ